MSVTASVSGDLQLTDNQSGSTTFLKALSLSYSGTVSAFAQQTLIGLTPITIDLQNSNAQFVYIKNIKTTFSSNLTVTWTPNGGASETAITLSPGSAIILCETDAVNGITALSLTASAANTPVEYLLVS